MKTWPVATLVLTLLVSCAFAGEVEIVSSAQLCIVSERLIRTKTQKEQNRQQCNGMYSKSAWGGDTDPFIETKFIKTTPPDGEDPLVSLVIFEWRDEDLVGVWPSEDAQKVRRILCSELRNTDE